LEIAAGGKAYTRNNLVDTRPIVGDQNGVRWICRIVFHAGGLTRCNSVQAEPFLETRYILGSLIGNAGNGITVSNQKARTVSVDAGTPRFSLRTETIFRIRGRRLDNFDNNALFASIFWTYAML